MPACVRVCVYVRTRARARMRHLPLCLHGMTALLPPCIAATNDGVLHMPQQCAAAAERSYARASACTRCPVPGCHSRCHASYALLYIVCHHALQKLGGADNSTHKVKLASVAAMRAVVRQVPGYRDLEASLQQLNTALHSSLGPILEAPAIPPPPGPSSRGQPAAAGDKRMRDDAPGCALRAVGQVHVHAVALWPAVTAEAHICDCSQPLP